MLTRLFTEGIGVAGRHFAEILAATTLGNVIGAFVTGIWLFEAIGTVSTLKLLIAITAVAIALVLFGIQRPFKHMRGAAAGLSAVAVLAALAIPGDYYKRFSVDGFQISSVVEGKNGVVSVVPTDRFFTLAAMFRTESGLAMTRFPVEGENYEAWRVNMAEAMALDPGFRPKRILVIGLGHAYGIRAMLDFPFVEEVVVVEISDEIADVVKQTSFAEIGTIFDDPRVTLVLADGRRYVQKALGRNDRFDLIQVRINEPWRAGASNLFTVEFFASLERLLNPGGYVAVRAMASHVVTGLQMFDTAFWVSDHVHVYFTNATPNLDDAAAAPEIAGAFGAPIPGQSGQKPEVLHVVELSLDDFADSRINTDDWPILEYSILDKAARASDRQLLANRPLELLEVPVN
ncbi:hypothetical protein [Oceaniradius stylonematis]|uniref:spermine/spermidine synthase domain-containing protein n=1 Tax=Oceaniradius stylonematis TaxID=2184161 RepID=UPI00273F8788|nr:hypothetical protein [Oceaniradius stylonematis]